MRRVPGRIVLGLSACGYPLTQLAVRRCGMRGAAVAEAVCARLAIRDASMIAADVPGRLRAVPAALLRLELAAGIVASVAGAVPAPGHAAGCPGVLADHRRVPATGSEGGRAVPGLARGR